MEGTFVIKKEEEEVIFHFEKLVGCPCNAQAEPYIGVPIDRPHPRPGWHVSQSPRVNTIIFIV